MVFGLIGTIGINRPTSSGQHDCGQQDAQIFRADRLDRGQQQLVRDRLASTGELMRSQGLIGEESGE